MGACTASHFHTMVSDSQRFCSKTWDEGFKEFGKEKGSIFCSKTWDEGFKEFGKENGSKILVKDSGMKGSNRLGRRTGQYFVQRLGMNEGFKEFGKENGSNILFKDLG